jgi:hypothetical protein
MAAEAAVQGGPSLAQGFHLRPGQAESGLEDLQDLVELAGLAVGGHDLLGLGFFFIALAHTGIFARMLVASQAL